MRQLPDAGQPVLVVAQHADAAQLGLVLTQIMDKQTSMLETALHSKDKKKDPLGSITEALGMASGIEGEDPTKAAGARGCVARAAIVQFQRRHPELVVTTIRACLVAVAKEVKDAEGTLRDWDHTEMAAFFHERVLCGIGQKGFKKYLQRDYARKTVEHKAWAKDQRQTLQFGL